MTTVAMQNLWAYIQGLNLSQRNAAWLEGKLAEERQARRRAKADDPTLMTQNELHAKIDEAEAQYRQGRCHAMLPGERFADFRRRIGR